MSDSAAGDGAILPEELREDLLDILGDVLEWELPPGRWDAVARILGTLIHQLAEGDLAALRTAIGELELESPIRTKRIGDSKQPAEAKAPPPAEVRDQQVFLVEQIGTQNPKGGGERDDPAARR